MGHMQLGEGKGDTLNSDLAHPDDSDYSDSTSPGYVLVVLDDCPTGKFLPTETHNRNTDPEIGPGG